MEQIGDSLGWGKIPVFKLTKYQKDVDNDPDNADNFKNTQHCVTGAVLTHDVMYTEFYFWKPPTSALCTKVE